MLDFSKLRLSSFKSFVEPIEIDIKDGLTGVVGPNGCGKSNLVEAIRWVMGEASYTVSYTHLTLPTIYSV